MSYIYLASPYSDPRPAVRRWRFERNMEALAILHRDKKAVFSPLVQWHNVAVIHALPDDYEFWRPQCETMLRSCLYMLILMLPGWEESKGVTFEREFCQQNRIIIVHSSLEKLVAEAEAKA